MKNDTIWCDKKKSYGTIARVRDGIATVIFYDGDRITISIDDYNFDEEEKVWKNT